MFLNAHTGTDITNLTIILTERAANKEAAEIFNLTNSRPYELTDIEYIGKRNIFTLFFEGLRPGTVYNVLAKDAITNLVLMRTTYRTLPGQNA